MITPAQVYWLTRMDSIHGAMCPVIFACGIGVLFTFFINGVALDRVAPKRFWIPWVVIAGIALMIKTFTPTTKEMAAIIIIPKVVNSAAENKAIREFPTNVMDLANEWLKELKPKPKEK